MSALVVIPARYSSTRFPGKPLADIGGLSMIERVYRQAQKARLVDAVMVATDDQRIFEAVLSFGGQVVMTSTEHQSGTDRILQAVNLMRSNEDIIVNVQGDEPFIQPEQIDSLLGLFEDPEVGIGTLLFPIDDEQTLQDPNKVKAVRASDNRALYFSRSAVPHARSPETQHYLHLGMYAYRNEVLQEIGQLPVSPLEKAESLEQLRWLEHGYSIHTALTDHRSIGIDTPEDLERAIKLL
jgi:3-deoxy-manno-octulosonate cytidylyltransferase (CMP-KDO synthetase)